MIGSKITIAGVPVTIASEEDCEGADFVVCCRSGMWTPFTDNVAASCADCGHPIFHRPTAPKTPPKICIECAGDRAGASIQ
jgi:hypothetical protein